MSHLIFLDLKIPNTRLDHFFGVNSTLWIDRLSHDVHIILGHNWWPVVDWLSGSVENATQHVFTKMFDRVDSRDI